MADRFFSARTQAAARAEFAVRFARVFDVDISTSLRAAEHAIFQRVLGASTVRTLEWRDSPRTTLRHALLMHMGEQFWEDLTAAERLSGLWALSELTPPGHGDTDAVIADTLTWGYPPDEHDAALPQGIEGTETQRMALDAQDQMPHYTANDMALRARVRNNHTARAIVQRLVHEEIDLSRRQRIALWRALYARDIVDRATHGIRRERARYPEGAARAAELIALYEKVVKADMERIERTDTRGFYSAYQQMLATVGEAMADAFVGVVRHANGINKRKMAAVLGTAPAPRVVGTEFVSTRFLSSDAERRIESALPNRAALPPVEHVELWLTLGTHHTVMLLRTGVLRADDTQPVHGTTNEYASRHVEATSLVRALRLVRYGLAPRVWPKGDGARYAALMSSVHMKLNAVQRISSTNIADQSPLWHSLRTMLVELCTGLLYADPASAVYARVVHDNATPAARAGLCVSMPGFRASLGSWSGHAPFIALPASWYDANIIDERRAWCAREVASSSAAAGAVYDYFYYDQSQRKDADHERFCADIRENPPQQAQEILLTPPQSQESDAEVAYALDRARRHLEREQRGTGRGGGKDDASLFDIRADFMPGGLGGDDDNMDDVGHDDL